MQHRLKIATVVVVVLVAAVAGGLWWFLRDDAPAAVDLSTAVEGVAEPDDAAADGDITGAWLVDAETGDFDYESASGTFAGFRIDEELASVGATTAVGRTGDVSGSVDIEGTTVTAAAFEIDLSTITTNESRRDDRVQEALETGEHPTASFTLTEPIELGSGAATGEQLSVTAVGDLAIHGVTRPVEFPLEAQLVNGVVVVVGSLDITFSDYEVQVPSSPAVLSVEDEGTLELQLLLDRG